MYKELSKEVGKINMQRNKIPTANKKSSGVFYSYFITLT